MGCTLKKEVGKWVPGKQTALLEQLTVKLHIQPTTVLRTLNGEDYILLSKNQSFQKAKVVGDPKGQYYFSGE